MKRIASATLSLAALSACAPLQQAPLVYSSKTVVGLDVSATTTETPGASFAFGYKSVDAAYVPVAVARTCEGSKTDCSTDIYRLQLIGGAARDGNTTVSDSARSLQARYLQQFGQAQEAAETAKLAQDTAANAHKKASQDLFEEVRRLDVIEAKSAEARSAEEKKVLEEKPQRLARLKEVESEKLKAFEAAKETAESRVATAKEFDPKRISEASAGANPVRTGVNTDKADAYSVFGSFDANTKTDITSSGLKDGKGAEAKVEPSIVLGKVFSTGVASQNLTLGMQKYYAEMAFTQAAKMVSECVATAHKVAEMMKDKNPEIVTAAFEACRSIGRVQAPPPAPASQPTVPANSKDEMKNTAAKG